MTPSEFVVWAGPMLAGALLFGEGVRWVQTQLAKLDAEITWAIRRAFNPLVPPRTEL